MLTSSLSAGALITASFTISPRGPFSLAEAATFGFGQRDGHGWDGVMRLAFCLDGYTTPAAAEVRQDAGGDVHLAVFAPPGTDLAAVRDQVARVLSLDHDATEFARIGERDPVIGRLQAAAPGLRPPLFYSPYEAAVWSVLSARRPARAMMHVRALVSEAYGRTFDLAGQRLAAFPTPSQLLRVDSFPGIGPDKIERLHGVARAALEGRLDVTALTDLGPGAAMTELQAIKGIGPFYSSLIVIRGTGFTDVLPVGEPRVLGLTAQLYGLPEPPTDPEFRALAEPWRPFRTWAAVLIRAATSRLLSPGGTTQCARPKQPVVSQAGRSQLDPHPGQHVPGSFPEWGRGPPAGHPGTGIRDPRCDQVQAGEERLHIPGSRARSAGPPSRAAGRARPASSRRRSAGSLLIRQHGPGPGSRPTASNRHSGAWLVMITS
jgi:DNA-3-methyladenine glycosylase II